MARDIKDNLNKHECPRNNKKIVSTCTGCGFTKLCRKMMELNIICNELLEEW
jgi:hypothetical protein